MYVFINIVLLYVWAYIYVYHGGGARQAGREPRRRRPCQHGRAPREPLPLSHFVFFNICICIYIHIYICIHICIYTHVNIYVCMPACMYVCMNLCAPWGMLCALTLTTPERFLRYSIVTNEKAVLDGFGGVEFL